MDAKLQESIEHDRANRALQKAKKIEAQRIEQGWRYIKTAPNMEILVPCDKNGNPTQEGLKRIEEHNKQNEIYKKKAILFGILK